MSESGDIPQDVWDAANAINDILTPSGVAKIARAILAERERAATVEPSPIELPPGSYGLAMIEAFWKGVAAGKFGVRAAIRTGGK